MVWTGKAMIGITVRGSNAVGSFARITNSAFIAIFRVWYRRLLVIGVKVQVLAHARCLGLLR